jgi:ribonucleoside-diphosphate reductase alpha chain
MSLNETSFVEMKPQQISVDVLLEKYAKGEDKSISDVRRRVANALVQKEYPKGKNSVARRNALESDFVWTQENGFVPGGRINSAAGTDLKATMVNCFVQSIADSITDTVEGTVSIYKALAQAAETMRKGGGVGYNFSNIRPMGAYVKGTKSYASGPLSYMRIFNVSCETVESAGGRRGAQMGMLNISHPDIEAFIHAKDTGEFKNFNLSVAVSDSFMQAVENDTDWNLVHEVPKQLCTDTQAIEGLKTGKQQVIEVNGKSVYVYKAVKARDLWDQIMKSTYDHAEPGIIFIDNVNNENNLYYCETIEATNP